MPVAGLALTHDDADPADRNGEPAEGDMGCLVILFALGGCCVVMFGAFLGVLAGSGC